MAPYKAELDPQAILPSVFLGSLKRPSAPPPKKLAPDCGKITIAMGFDAPYAPHSLTALASVFGTASQPETLEVYLLHQGTLPAELRKKFSALAPCPDQIHFCEIDDALLSQMPVVNDHITLPTYYRLLLPSLISADKALWLDGDLILCDDIARLWQTDLSAFALAGIGDLSEKEEITRLKAFYRDDPAKRYVNGGVTLFNLYFIRRLYPDFLAACRAFITQYPEVVQLEDQDLLNLLFIGKIKTLPLRWNLYASFCNKWRQNHFFTKDEVKTALEHPAVIHYTSPWNKPWKVRVRTRFKGLYWFWRRQAELRPRLFSEKLSEMLSPCYYLCRGQRVFLHFLFFSCLWKAPKSASRPFFCLGKWQGVLKEDY